MKSCGVCGERLEVHFHKVLDPITRESFAIHKCRRCGLGHTVPRPPDLSPYYSSPYYGNRHSFTLQMCIKRRLGFVSAATRAGNGKKMLDIGCGDGSFLLAAKRTGWAVMGTERNPEPARSLGIEVVETLDDISSAGRFDCVTMWHALEHMRDIPSTLGQVAGLLNPEGYLLIAVPDCGGLQARVFRGRWLHLDVPRHLYHFDAGSLDYCLGSSGFSVVRRWHQEFEYDLLGWSQSALNFLMPSHPNVFFDTLTGKQGDAGGFMALSTAVLGSVLTVLALPALLAGTLSGRGGTLVVAARRNVDRPDSP